jgi:hypothetical protein
MSSRWIRFYYKRKNKKLPVHKLVVLDLELQIGVVNLVKHSLMDNHATQVSVLHILTQLVLLVFSLFLKQRSSGIEMSQS